MPLGSLWSPEEDERLAELVRLHGAKRWSQISSDLGSNKGSKQCRRRWKNFLSLDDRKLGSWTPEEDAHLLECHRRHGNKWTLIAQEIGGRTDNAVKNRWAALEKRSRGGDGAASISYGANKATNSDLLAVRRIIAKADQPGRAGYGARQLPSAADAAWLQEQLVAAATAAVAQQQQQAAAVAAAAMQQQQQQQQHVEQQLAAYNMQAAAAAAAGYGQAVDQAAASLGLQAAGRKPDLVINIPGTTAPEVPYSHRTAAGLPGAADAARAQPGAGVALTPSALWLGTALAPMEGVAIKHEDDPLLSLTRQGAAALVGLATPTDDGPNGMADLFRYLYGAGATPAGAAAAASNAAAAPWAAGGGQQAAAAPQQQQQQSLTSMLVSAAAGATTPQVPSLQQLLQSFEQPAASQPQQQQAAASFAKLQPDAGEQQPGMMLRQEMPAQTCFVPQQPPAGAAAVAAPMLAASVAPLASGPLASTAAMQPGMMAMPAASCAPALPLQPSGGDCFLPPSMSSGMLMMMPAAAGDASQQPLPLVRSQQALLQPGQQQWGPEELRQLLDILGEQAAISDGGQAMLPGSCNSVAALALAAPQQGCCQPGAAAAGGLTQQLCSLDARPSCDSDEVEHANNVTGHMLAAASLG